MKGSEDKVGIPCDCFVSSCTEWDQYKIQQTDGYERGEEGRVRKRRGG